MTKAHDDRIRTEGEDYGYSIRVGKTLPPNSANLAYVHSPRVSPRTNLLITDLSSDIVDNVISSKMSSETRVFPDDTFLLRELGTPYHSPTSNIILTDEFSVPLTAQEKPVSLYYRAEAKGLFDGRGSDVVYWPGGFVENPITEVMSYSQIDQSRLANVGSLLYLGDKITITKLDGTPIDSTKKFKVQLIPQTGEGVPPHAFKILIYTNFRGLENETYMIHYEKYNADGSHTLDFTEILNAYPFFSEVSKDEIDFLADNPKINGEWRSELFEKKYAVLETENKQWKVYSPAQVLIADNVNRPAHQFEYRIRGKLRAKLNSSEHGVINVGLFYTNENIFGVEDLTDALKKTFESSYKPPYLDFVNPHPIERGLPKENPKYWTIDLSMPSEYLNDYDLIIITGYGNINMSRYNDSLREYLSNGGRLWIDNAGSGTSVLNLQNFLTNIGFSSTEESTGLKVSGVEAATDPLSLEVQAIDRLYVINRNNVSIGYPSVNPKITFGVGESKNLWVDIVKYSTNDPSFITRNIYGNGTLILSNCGIFRSLVNRVSDDIKIAINTILSIAEHKWISTPWIRDYVYHRDNLFKEEYRNGNIDVYVDDRNDNDSTQIVAKKIINKTVRQALIPYMPSSFYKAKGSFSIEVKSDISIPIKNNDFEVGSHDASTEEAITEWSSPTPNAIPGWGTDVLSGSVNFEHISSVSKRGTKALRISADEESVGFWYTNIGSLSSGTYKASVWIKTSEVQGRGIKVGVYRANNTLVAESNSVVGTMDWVQIDVPFGLNSSTDLSLRVGFTEGGSGTAWIDLVSLVSVGSVYMTPENDGNRALYAYAVRPRGDIFDLRSQGFSNADVTIYDPEIKINYTIRSFVYAWDSDLTRYIRKYGQSKTYTATIRRSDGLVNLGLVTTLLPALEAGPEWANRDQVFFEISVGGVSPNDSSSRFVNVAFLNTKTGQYFYGKNGENIIGYNQIFQNGAEAHVIVQAWTDYYTIRATKRRYSVMIQDDERIYLDYPATIDDRDSWFLRIHNGSFIKGDLQYDEYESFKLFYEGRQFGTYKYSIPEYRTQLFSPSQPYRKVREEIAEYINDNTIRVQRNPLYVQIGSARGETLSLALSTDNRIFKSRHTNWSKDFIPKIYTDNMGNGIFLETNIPYDIDYENGIVIFEEEVYGNVKADYDYKNLRVFKRTYLNSKINKEPLQMSTKTSDQRTFVSNHRNWLLYPSPIVWVKPEGSSEYQVLPIESYKIHYEEGVIEFKEDTHDKIYVDYSYCVEKELPVKDFDIQSGLIYLENQIDFKDEIYVSYFYEERFFEYRGYYDSDLGKFVHLDLNPTEGHYCTLPVYRADGSGSIIKYENVPTSRLMNKEVYVYILPSTGSFGVENNYTIRHCYSEAEWLKIKRTMPGIALLLGVIQLREHTTVNDIVVMDTRVRGGGLKSNISKEVIKQRDTTSTSYWDIGPWDGAAYYKNGVLVIQLPKSILKSNGGQFTEEDVNDILKKYVAYGVYCLVEYVDQVSSGESRTLFIQGASFANTLNE